MAIWKNGFINAKNAFLAPLSIIQAIKIGHCGGKFFSHFGRKRWTYFFNFSSPFSTILMHDLEFFNAQKQFEQKFVKYFSNPE